MVSTNSQEDTMTKIDAESWETKIDPYINKLFPWYAVRTRSRHEKFATTHLRATGFEVYLPLVAKVRQWKDRKTCIQFPLFPGYCFVRCEVGGFREVRKAPGVVELVGIAGKPVSIPEKEIESLHQLMSSSLPFDPHPRLEPGATVRVVRGPLEGVEGVLVRKSPKARLLIAVQLLSQGATVEIDAEDVVA